MKKLLFILSLALGLATITAYADVTPAELEARIIALEKRLTNCHLQPTYVGRFMNWCPYDAYVNAVDLMTLGNSTNTYVRCYRYDWVCLQ